jgi:bacterioferritin
MSKNEKVIEILNKAIALEMTATNQYMYFHFRCGDYGYEPLQ